MSRFLDFLRLLNQPCREMCRLASESLDRELTRRERVALRSHAVYCAACRRFARQLLVVRAAARGLADRAGSAAPPIGPAMPEDVRERIKRRLGEGE